MNVIHKKFEYKRMKSLTFLQECKAELEKVQWPTKEEVINSTGVVLVTVVIFSMFLLISDSLFVRLLSWLWSVTG
jgi:preprotein translocase subunit SecE